MVLASRGLRELTDGRKGRIPGEWSVAILRQARKVWVQTVVVTALVTMTAVLAASLGR